MAPCPRCGCPPVPWGGEDVCMCDDEDEEDYTERPDVCDDCDDEDDWDL